MAKKKSLSPNQQAFKKEQARLRAAQRKLEKQGYYFMENMVPDLPKRVTAQALKRIRAMKPQDLRMAAIWVDRETGEVLGTGLDLYNKQRRQKASKLSKAGKSPENISRLREYSAKRSGKRIKAWDSYNRNVLGSYYDEQKAMSYAYDDEVVVVWRNFWPLMENTYGWQIVADCLVKIDGVPDPVGVPTSQQWLAYIHVTTDLMRELKKRNLMTDDVQDALDNIATAIDESTPVGDEELEDMYWR